jgi:RNase P/RNase MRP subunit POP5
MPAFVSERTLLVSVETDERERLTTSALHAAVRDAIRDQFGDFGAGCVLTSLSSRNYSSDTGCFLIRVRRDHARMVSTAVGCVPFVQLGSTRLPVQLTVTKTAGRRGNSHPLRAGGDSWAPCGRQRANGAAHV